MPRKLPPGVTMSTPTPGPTMSTPTSPVGPPVSSPMIEQFLGPTLSGNPQIREEFGLGPQVEKFKRQFGGGR